MPRPVKVHAPAPAFAFTAAQLRLHVERLGAQRVADVLRVTVAALEPLLAGRVEMTGPRCGGCGRRRDDLRPTTPSPTRLRSPLAARLAAALHDAGDCETITLI